MKTENRTSVMVVPPKEADEREKGLKPKGKILIHLNEKNDEMGRTHNKLFVGYSSKEMSS